ncbi:hypothetical protein PR048_030732 [Dryococelus australis]|uniref:Uncharacterized protein n=1 Tax=Dryococelus australis TaxID=614101 RepID=A0ABQ9GAH7_9NEOP|nr:hypothetical protein PR048_030732 [Dryococelus australis]
MLQPGMRPPKSEGELGATEACSIDSLIASTRKSLNWREVLPSITRLYETFSGDPTRIFNCRLTKARRHVECALDKLHEHLNVSNDCVKLCMLWRCQLPISFTKGGGAGGGYKTTPDWNMFYRRASCRGKESWILYETAVDYFDHDGNTVRLGRRSEEAVVVCVTVARIASSLLDFGRASYILMHLDTARRQPARVNRDGGKTSRPTASSGTIPTCENPVTRPGIEPWSQWWEASGLTAQPPWPLACVESCLLLDVLVHWKYQLLRAVFLSSLLCVGNWDGASTMSEGKGRGSEGQWGKENCYLRDGLHPASRTLGAGGGSHTFAKVDSSTADICFQRSKPGTRRRAGKRDKWQGTVRHPPATYQFQSEADKIIFCGTMLRGPGCSHFLVYRRMLWNIDLVSQRNSEAVSRIGRSCRQNDHFGHGLSVPNLREGQGRRYLGVTGCPREELSWSGRTDAWRVSERQKSERYDQ